MGHYQSIGFPEDLRTPSTKHPVDDVPFFSRKGSVARADSSVVYKICLIEDTCAGIFLMMEPPVWYLPFMMAVHLVILPLRSQNIMKLETSTLQMCSLIFLSKFLLFPVKTSAISTCCTVTTRSKCRKVPMEYLICRCIIWTLLSNVIMRFWKRCKRWSTCSLLRRLHLACSAVGIWENEPASWVQRAVRWNVLTMIWLRLENKHLFKSLFKMRFVMPNSCWLGLRLICSGFVSSPRLHNII